MQYIIKNPTNCLIKVVKNGDFSVYFFIILYVCKTGIILVKIEDFKTLVLMIHIK